MNGYDYGQTWLFYRMIHTLPWLSDPFNLNEYFLQTLVLSTRVDFTTTYTLLQEFCCYHEKDDLWTEELTP